METSRCYSRTTTHTTIHSVGMTINAHGMTIIARGMTIKLFLWDPYEFFTILNYFTFFSSPYIWEEQGIHSENCHV